MEIMQLKGPEWGLHPASVAMLCERIDMFNALTWRQVVEIIEQLATGVDPTAAGAVEAAAPEAAAPAA